MDPFHLLLLAVAVAVLVADSREPASAAAHASHRPPLRSKENRPGR